MFFAFPFWWQAFLTGKVVCVCACVCKMGANYNGQYLSSHKSLDRITLVKRFYKLGVLWKCIFLSQRGIQKIFQLYITPERSTSAFMWYSFKHLLKLTCEGLKKLAGVSSYLPLCEFREHTLAIRLRSGCLYLLQLLSDFVWHFKSWVSVL